MALEMNLEVSHISEALRGFWFLCGFWKSGSEQEEKKESRRFLKEWQRTFQAFFSYPRACFEHILLKKLTSLCRLKVAALKTVQMWSFALPWPHYVRLISLLCKQINLF